MGVYYVHYLIPLDNSFRPEPQRIAALIDALAAARFIPRPEAGDGPSYLLDDWRREAAERTTSAAQEPPKPWWKRIFGSKAPEQPPVLDLVDVERPFAVPLTEESFAALADRAVTVGWTIEDPLANGLAYPFEQRPSRDDPPNYRLLIEASEDFRTETINCYDDTGTVDPHCRCGEDLSYSRAPFEDVAIRRLCPSCGARFEPRERLVTFTNGATGESQTIHGGICYRFAVAIDCEKSIPPAIEDGKEGKLSRRFLDACSEALGVELYELGSYS
ncbi:hypothetical protein [Methylosinus sp. LW4]|uniref:hypothetical protein n=1 Tax=Methylosinus sp. LW4 TaxID=136993 RepID=UPI0003A10944|nr:hypothetical protein [Methylosinus sp. LW4]